MVTLPARRQRLSRGSRPERPADPGPTGIVALIAPFIVVELTSGLLQGYYIPLVSQISHHLGIPKADYNWFEAIQLIVSALAVPVLSRIGDIHGHKRVFLGAAAITSLATWAMVIAGGFGSYLVAFSLQGVYAVWFPLEVALLFTALRRSGQAATISRRATGYLVVALSIGAIIGALSGAGIYSVVGKSIPLTLAVPALATSLCAVVVAIFVRESEPQPGRQIDAVGFAQLTLVLLALTGGLALVRLNGVGAWWAWSLMLAGIGAIYPLGRHLQRASQPALDLSVLKRSTMWPVQLTALLSGVGVLGAQIPMSTFASTDPRTHGFGLGLSPASISYVTGCYLLALMIGAVTMSRVAVRYSPRTALFAYSLLSGLGYLLLIPFHANVIELALALLLAGVGAGGVAAALPAVAAVAAPGNQTGIATGMTNTAKMVGGAFASAIFGMLLHSAGDATKGSAHSITPYLVIWAICGGVSVLSLFLLTSLPKAAFVDQT